MKSRLLVLSVVVPLVLALATLASACGDDEEKELTLEDYFGQLESIEQRASPRFEGLERRYPDAFQDVDSASNALDASLDISSQVRDDLTGVEPPADVADEHQDLIEALNALIDLQSLGKSLVEDVTSTEQLQQLKDDFLSDPTYTNADKAWDDACQALQDIADANNIDVNLGCGED